MRAWNFLAHQFADVIPSLFFDKQEFTLSFPFFFFGMLFPRWLPGWILYLLRHCAQVSLAPRDLLSHFILVFTIPLYIVLAFILRQL